MAALVVDLCLVKNINLLTTTIAEKLQRKGKT